MKRIVIFFGFAASLFAWADSERHTREQLESFHKADLVNLVLRLEEQLFGSTPNPGDGRQCRTYNPLAGEYGQILAPLMHEGYSDHGTLRWPNGVDFMTRHRNYSDDFNLSYMNGKTLKVAHENYSDDGTIKWSNGQTLYLAHQNYSDDGSVFRPDGSYMLKRHQNYSDDRSRYGLPVERFEEGSTVTQARLTSDDNVEVQIRTGGPGWSVTIRLDAHRGSVSVEECF